MSSRGTLINGGRRWGLPSVFDPADVLLVSVWSSFTLRLQPVRLSAKSDSLFTETPLVQESLADINLWLHYHQWLHNIQHRHSIYRMKVPKVPSFRKLFRSFWGPRISVSPSSPEVQKGLERQQIQGVQTILQVKTLDLRGSRKSRGPKALRQHGPDGS